MNTVEEGEVKFGDYVFSNRLSLGGNITQLGSKENTFAGGGNLKKDPPKSSSNPVAGPMPDKEPLEFTKSEWQKTPYGGLKKVEEKFQVPDVRDEYIKNKYIYTDDKVDFNLAINDKNALEFLNRYNDPWTRQKLSEQAGLKPEDIDNMILKGLNVDKEIDGQVANSKASYDSKLNKINIDSKFNNKPGIETHERVHASLFDAAQGDNLMEILGNPFQQEGKSFLKERDPEIVRYMKKPHEAYGNFVEFREQLGLKPGQQVTPAQVEELVKKKNLSNENFYGVFNIENITKALNTIASTGNRPTTDEYRIA
jgi:hypothetical protein